MQIDRDPPRKSQSLKVNRNFGRMPNYLVERESREAPQQVPDGQVVRQMTEKERRCAVSALEAQR